ncbi:YlcI/YnfO family protein [Amphibiibacter pelophylacis]|uniref:YlcI/YnfO family protein n=1 Tax=Amphibiibacter pelophylacis TaxID=1799477 RepID=A0ACC6P220_9BURK
MKYTALMKTASLPPVRVAPELRRDLESVLQQGETLSQLVECAVRSVVEQRRHHAEFVRRGLASIQDAQRTGSSIPAETVLAGLEARLETARAGLPARRS